MYRVRDDATRRFDSIAGLVWRVLPFAAILLLSSTPGWADDSFRELVARLPRTTNAVAIFNMDKIKKSPMAIKEGFAENLEKAYRSGLVRIPPRATRLVTAAQLDIEFMQPIYEVAVFDLDRQPSMKKIAEEYSGTIDTLNRLEAAKLATDSYAVRLDRQTLGVMRPANRQAVLHWLRESPTPGEPGLSAYITEAAGYSDDAGTDIILAIDVKGAFSLERVVEYLKSKQAMLDEAGIQLNAAAKLLRDVDGLRVGIRIGEKPYGSVVVDFREPGDIPKDFAKTLLLEILADAGAQFDDLQKWECKVGVSSVSLSGHLTRDGLRRLVSLVDSPAPVHASATGGEESTSPGETTSDKATTSLEYFSTIDSMFQDLQRGWRNLKSVSSGSVFLDRYARRIEKLPMLNVDSDLLDYGQYVAVQLRLASRAVRTMGIRGGARQAQVTDTVYYGGYRSGYGVGYRWGWGQQGWAYRDSGSDQRRRIRAQEKGVMANDVFTIRDNIISATNEVRRGLTERYQIQF